MLYLNILENEKSVQTSNIEILDIQVLNAGCDEKTDNDSTIRVPFDLEVGDTTSKKALNFDDGGSFDFNRPNVDYLDSVSVHEVEKNSTFTKVQNANEFNGSKVKELFSVNAPNALNDVTLTNDQNENHVNDPNINANAPKINLPIKEPDQYKQIEKHFFDEDLTMDGSDTPLEHALVRPNSTYH